MQYGKGRPAGEQTPKPDDPSLFAPSCAPFALFRNRRSGFRALTAWPEMGCRFVPDRAPALDNPLA